MHRNAFAFKNKLSKFFAEYKLVIIVSLLFLLVGIGTGIFTAVKYSGDIALDNLADANLVDFLKGNKGTMGLLFPYVFLFCVFSGVIIFVNFKPFMIGVSFLALIIRGYLLGFDITILIILYGFAGILNVFIIILPFDLLACFVLVLISSIAIKRNLNIKKFGFSHCNKNGIINYTKTYWFLVVIGVLSILLKCLMLPLIRITIIVK